jgi:hypothetical protein
LDGINESLQITLTEVMAKRPVLGLFTAELETKLGFAPIPIADHMHANANSIDVEPVVGFESFSKNTQSFFELSLLALGLLPLAIGLPCPSTPFACDFP